jgi:hypothetical protein
MENENQPVKEKCECGECGECQGFFGSKANTALLATLIVLMIIALMWMWQDKQKYFGIMESKVEEVTTEQQEVKSISNKTEIINTFLPENTRLEKWIDIDLDGDGKLETVFSYMLQADFRDAIDKQLWNSGFVVIGTLDNGNYELLLDHKDFSGNGSGVWSAPQIFSIKDSGVKGKSALVVISSFSGASTTMTGWSVFAKDGREIKNLPNDTLRTTAFEKIGYKESNWNNNVFVEKERIIEGGSGYSEEAYICCPDRNPWQMIFSYTAGKLKLENVSILPKYE